MIVNSAAIRPMLRHGVAVRRNLGHGERVGLRTTLRSKAIIAKPRPLALVNRNAATKIGQREGCASVTTVDGPEKGEDSLVLVDGKQLAVAKSPATGREVSAKHDDFGEERFRHWFLWL